MSRCLLHLRLLKRDCRLERQQNSMASQGAHFKIVFGAKWFMEGILVLSHTPSPTSALSYFTPSSKPTATKSASTSSPTTPASSSPSGSGLEKRKLERERKKEREELQKLKAEQRAKKAEERAKLAEKKAET